MRRPVYFFYGNYSLFILNQKMKGMEDQLMTLEMPLIYKMLKRKKKLKRQMKHLCSLEFCCSDNLIISRFGSFFFYFGSLASR